MSLHAMAIGSLVADPIRRTGASGKATSELRIPRTTWDGVLFLELLERHSGTIQ